MRSIAILALALLSLPTWAQTYRWVDPATGRTIISDSPPPVTAKKVTRTRDAVATDEGDLPFAVRRAKENFPVTLYTAPECTTLCKQARELLKARSIPFSERVIQKKEEADELKTLIGELTVPALKVGNQSAKGFDADSYNSLLDMAGYPQSRSNGKNSADASPDNP